MKLRDRRFYALDGLRGVAAIAVMLLHYTDKGIRILQGAWLAVDLFFLLSGFVIAYAYDRRIREGLGGWAFVTQRLMRLGPLYFVGTTLGAIAILISNSNSQRPSLLSAEFWIALTLGLSGIPLFSSLNGLFEGNFRVDSIFPFNPPGWSLFFEVFVNIVFYVIWRFRRGSVLGLTIAAAFIFVGCSAIFKLVNPGWGPEHFIFGFPRVITEFFLGTLLYTWRVYKKKFHMSIHIILLLTCATLFSLNNVKTNIVASITIIPGTIAAFSALCTSKRINGYCSFLGDLSYPLYILHMPIYMLFMSLNGMKQLVSTYQLNALCLIAITIAALTIPLDKAFRKWLQSRLSAHAHARAGAPVGNRLS